MSPLWRDEVRIFIGPGKIALARMRRGIRPTCISELEISIESGKDIDWQPACNVLSEQLDNALWKDANARIVLADHWTRYAILPWSSEISSDSERLAHAKLLLANTYGDLIETWTVCISNNRPLATAIVSAIPSELLRHLEQTLQAHNLRLSSLQSNLIVAYNAWRDSLPENTAWFASIDDGTLAAMHITNGQCDQVRSVRISDSWATEIRRIQTAGRLAQTGAAECPVYIDAPSWLKSGKEVADSSVQWLGNADETDTHTDKISLMKGMHS